MQDTMEIPLTQGKSAIIDAEEYERVAQFKWCYTKMGYTGYALRREPSNGKQRGVFMHRDILGAPKGAKVDHKDGDGLNNRKDNLRLCTTAQNAHNKVSRTGTSAYKGVHWYKRDGKWESNLKAHGKSYHLGRYDSEEEAARAYDAKAIEMFGEFARLNFPNGITQA